MSAKKYIDRDAALFELRTGFFPQSMEFTQAVSIAKGIIERAPCVDAVEVVRCKDCKRCESYYPSKKKGEEPYPLVYECKKERKCVLPTHYCSYGERRDTDEQRQAD